MSNDRLEPFNYHNIAFKRCPDVVSLERLDRLWFFRHHWFVKTGWFGKCWTNLLAFWGVWNWSRILNFGPDWLFFRFSPSPGSDACPKNTAVQVWSKSTHSFRRQGADKPFSTNLTLSVSLKMESRSSKSNQFFSMSQQLRCRSLVKIHSFTPDRVQTSNFPTI